METFDYDLKSGYIPQMLRNLTHVPGLQSGIYDRGVLLELGDFGNQSSRTQKRKTPQGKIDSSFSRKLKNCTLNKNYNPQTTAIRAFFPPKLGHFFLISEKVQGRSLPLLPLQSRTGCLERGGGAQGNGTGKEGFDICFCVFFNCYCQGLSSWGDQPLGYVSTQIRYFSNIS